MKLSGTDLEVSEVGFGGIPIIPLPKNEAVSIVKHCFDLGMTLFDTANMYLTSEEKIGTALEPVRDKVVIASKTTQRDANGAADH
ncbi:MAG: aldo/keto reductase, partial [Desulfobacterales bacterium]|nr:aldo/keto reductase [Desulfobacterales bacterium]